MPDVMPSTWFVSRRLGLPLAAAATALDGLVEDRRHSDRSASIPLTDRLEIRPAVALAGEARRLNARLRLGGLARPLRVELELGPWSRFESEVGIRPRRRLGMTGAERYWAGASDALDALRTALPPFASEPPSIVTVDHATRRSGSAGSPIV